MFLNLRATGIPLALALVLAVIGAGCAGSAKATQSVTTSSTTTASAGAASGSVYANLGNFTVGVVTLHLPDGDAVEVWYPANGAVGVGSDTYDVRSFLPAAVAQKLAPSVHAYVGTDASRNVVVGAAGEKFPLVVFSHGYGGYRDQSTFLMTRLASWGMVVAAPDHPSRDLSQVLAPTPAATTTAVDDVLATIDAMQRENARAGGPFQGRIDLSRIAVVGFDAGGATAVAAAADPLVDAYVVLASANQPVGGGAPVTTGLPAKPSLFLAAADDRVVPAADVAAVYRAAPAPSYEWVIRGAGHNAFDDVCIVAKPQGGLVGLADKSGIGASFPPALRANMTDGCAPPDLDVTKTWGIVDEAVTGFLRHFIGPDKVAVDVGPAGPRTIDGVKITVAAHVD